MNDKVWCIAFMVLAVSFIGIDLLTGVDESAKVIGLMVLSKLYSISYEME